MKIGNKEKFFGLYQHIENQRLYQAGGIIKVKTESGEWKDYVIYKDQKTNRESARSIENFKERFEKVSGKRKAYG